MFRSSVQSFKRFTTRLFHRPTPSVDELKLVTYSSTSLNSIYKGSATLKQAFKEALQEPELVFNAHKPTKKIKVVLQLSDIAEEQTADIQVW